MEGASNDTQNHNTSKTDKKEEKWKESLVLGRMVHHVGYKRTRLPNPVSIFVTKLIYLYVNSILEATGMWDNRFTGKVLPCGSFLEGSKICNPDEYDFMYELERFSASKMRLEPVPQVTYSPRRKGDTAAGGYFRLFYTSVETLDYERCQQLESRLLQQDFHSAIKTAASQWNPYSLIPQATECSGPAVTVYVTLEMSGFRNFIARFKSGENDTIKKYASHALKQCKTMEKRTIRLDIVPAIRVLLTKDEIRQANIDVVDSVLESDNLDCHVVPSGDFWKLSLAQHEARLLMTLCGVKWKHSTQNQLEYQPNMDCCGIDDELRPLLCQGRCSSPSDFVSFKLQMTRAHCLKSLKYIRDVLDTSTIRETDLLGSYPLKASFLHECLEYQDESFWTEEELGRRVFNVLDRIDTKGKDGTLTGCFMTNVPILKEGDKCYLEVRRVKDYIKGVAEKSVKRGVLHAFILLIQLVLSCSTLWTTVNFLNCDRLENPSIDISSQTIFQFEIGLFGAIWCMCGRYCLSTKSESNMLYRIFSCPLLLHLVSTALSIPGFILTSSDPVDCKTLFTGPRYIRNVVYAIVIFHSVFSFAFLFHLLLVCIRGKGRCRDRCCELIFADHLYADCLRPNRYVNERTYTHYFKDALIEDGMYV